MAFLYAPNCPMNNWEAMTNRQISGGKPDCICKPSSGTSSSGNPNFTRHHLISHANNTYITVTVV